MNSISKYNYTIQNTQTKMNTMTGIIGQQKRLRDFLQNDNRSLLIEATDGLRGISFENVKNVLEKFTQGNAKADAIILSPGEARKHYQYFSAKRAPALIVRADYSNYLLDEKSLYPAQSLRHASICSAEEALRIGASAVILDLYLGGVETTSVENMQMLRKLTDDGVTIGIPIIVNMIPFGDRIDAKNFDDVVILGTRMALELGANLVSAPLLSPQKLKELKDTTIGSPILLNDYPNPSLQDVNSSPESMQNIKKIELNGLIVNGFAKEITFDTVYSALHS